MFKKLGELNITNDHHYDKIVKALEKAGIALILTSETYVEKHYIVAIDDNKEKESE